YSVAADKRRVQDVAASVGVESPRTWFPQTEQELEGLDLQYPVVLKPGKRQSLNELTTDKAWRIDDRDSLIRRWREALRLLTIEDLLVQELVPGGGDRQLSFAAVCKDGEPRLSVTARRSRQYPRDFGRASTFVQTALLPDVSGAAIRLLAALHVDGLVEVEFKRDPRDDALKLLDVNLRAWGWHSIGAVAGVDFGYGAYLLALGREVPVRTGQSGVRWTRLALDLPPAVRAIARGQEKLTDYVWSLRPPLHGPIAARDDLLPAVVEIPLLVRTMGRRRRDGRRQSHGRPLVDPAAGCPLEILELHDPRWIAFVSSHPDATPFHHPSWGRLVGECYGFPSFAAAVVGPDGGIIAGMPMAEVRHGSGRPKWVSLPFTDHCPPLHETPGDAVPLRAMLRGTLASSNMKSIQVRGELSGEPFFQVGVRHLLKLDSDPDAVFHAFHRSQVQRNIRRAQQERVTVRRADRELDLTDTFYRLHLMSRRRLGVPVQPRRFFTLLWRRVLAGGLGSLLIAEVEGRPVAAAVFLRHNGTVLYKYGASDSSAWPVRPNHALFWQAIRTACTDGDSWLDWGRTDLDNGGLRTFKASWGAQELPLVHTVLRAAPAGWAMPAGWGAQSTRTAAGVIKQGPPWVCRLAGETLYRYGA
ncbi:MAG: D-aspartate ligase, partial [Pseudonocardiales bacterium]|nr:D-aspartate ligase [Pseudonocardiales bacterium]